MEQLNRKKIAHKLWIVKDRCYNPENKSYKDYGAKGVKISDEFLNDVNAWVQHLIDLGWYEGSALSRYNDVGNYERGNIKIQSFGENAREVGIRRGSNIRCLETNQVFVTVVDAAQWIKDTYKYDGKTKTVAENIRCKGLKGSVSYGHTWERTDDDA